MAVPQFFEFGPLRRHGFAVLTVAVALALKLSLGDANGQHAPLLILALSVMMGAWYGGLGPGLLATALAAVTAVYFVIPPLYSFRIVDAAGWVQLTVFASEGVLISLLCEARRRSRMELEAARDSERRASADTSALRREVRDLRAELARARADLQYFLLSELDRSAEVNCDALIESLAARASASVTHSPLPTVRGNGPQLRDLFTRLLSGDVHIAAGSQGDGWTFCIQYKGEPASCDAIARSVVAGHGGSVDVEGSSLRIHFPRRIH